MKKLFVLFAGIVLCLCLASCNKYEESMYNKSDYQIQYVWYKSNAGNPNETFTYDKKKMLSRIDIIDSSDLNDIRVEVFEFTYNKDKTVQSISHTNGETSESIDFGYLNRYVKYMNYTQDGEIRLTSNFFRDDEEAAKITRIVEIYDRDFFENTQSYSKTALFRKFIGDPAKVKELAVAGTKSLTLYCNKTITYDGENIVEIKEEYPYTHKTVKTVKTYSGVLNPYYGLNYCYAKDLAGFSKNTVASSTITTYFDGILTNMEQTDYQYDDVNKDNYPRVFKYTSNKNPGVTFKTYITYVSEYKK